MPSLFKGISSMPQIRCPNCGLTINLENRKDTDMQLITTAVEHNANSFTDLLHSTKLPRKTLSLRLKELCGNGVLAKVDGAYKLNGVSRPERRAANPFNRVSSVLSDRRVKGLILLGLVLIGFPAMSYALATLFQQAPSINVTNEPKLLGSCTVALEVHDVKDLYAWQAIIAFNATELKFLNAIAGDAFKVKYPLFPNASDLGVKGLILVGATLEGNVSGLDIETGTLAVIEFGYYVSNYHTPQIVKSARGFETYLLDSQYPAQMIPMSGSTLSLKIVP
jgi:hypothetical protein